MTHDSIYMFRFILAISLLCSFSAPAQLLSDTLAQRQAKEAIDKIYNFEFDKAEPILAALQKRYPKHPVSSLLMALYTSWKFFPIDTKAQSYLTYQHYLRETLERTKNTFGEGTD